MDAAVMRPCGNQRDPLPDFSDLGHAAYPDRLKSIVAERSSDERGRRVQQWMGWESWADFSLKNENKNDVTLDKCGTTLSRAL